MEKTKLIENLIKIANQLDSNGMFHEANVITKIAMDLEDDDSNKNPLDVDIIELDMDEMFDDSTKGRIVELDSSKGQGKADIGEAGDPMIIDFKYLPEKNYGILEKNTQSKLGVGDIVLLSEPGSLVEMYAALGIVKKYQSKNMFMKSTKVLS